ncbi:MAG: HAD-IA family hydrolase [Eubacteriales bacterium]
MQYKGVIFDFDGTLIDSEEGIACAFQMALKSKGIAEDLEVIRGLIGPPLTRTIITKYKLSEEDGAQAMEIHRKYYQEIGALQSKLYPNIKDLLTSLKKMGAKMMIATNKPESLAFMQIKHYDIGHYFHAIVGNNDLQTRGSKADFIRIASKDVGVDKSQLLMVGDRYNDIEAGKEVGLDTIGVTYGYGSLEEIQGTHATYIVNDPMEIVEIVKGTKEKK